MPVGDPVPKLATDAALPPLTALPCNIIKCALTRLRQKSNSHTRRHVIRRNWVGSYFMNRHWAELKQRSLAKGPKGELLSLLTGTETEAEVRQLIIHLVQECQYSQLCPAGKAHSGCPFRAMAGLSYHSMKDMAETMPFADCLKLFEMEQDCRANQPDCAAKYPSG